MDNLFIVESPLQALVAVELCLQFSEQNNGIIYRLSGKGRERNDNQICKVIERGQWDFIRQISFNTSGGLAHHLSVRKFIIGLRKEFAGSVRNVFFGEFRSQWMHIARFALAPEKCILMDDGAAILTVKKEYIDKGILYPQNLWANNSLPKKLIKDVIYQRLFDKKQLAKPLSYASAFLKDESLFPIDFSSIRHQLLSAKVNESNKDSAYFFGSKYSEAGIVSRDYELKFISRVKVFYENRGLNLIYCAHRDESDEKIGAIRDSVGVHVVVPDMPAEVFMIDNHQSAQEISSAYSSVLNNFQMIFPEKPIRSFMLDPDEVAIKNKKNIAYIYQSLESSGIFIEKI